jgi:hypothetical protein
MGNSYQLRIFITLMYIKNTKVFFFLGLSQQSRLTYGLLILTLLINEEGSPKNKTFLWQTHIN